MTDNSPLLFARTDTTIVSVVTVVDVFPAGTFHYRLAFNAEGEVIYRSPWGPGASGNVNGY